MKRPDVTVGAFYNHKTKTMLYTEKFYELLEYIEQNVMYIKHGFTDERFQSKKLPIKGIHVRGDSVCYYKNTADISRDSEGRLPNKGLITTRPTRLLRSIFENSMDDKQYEAVANAIKAFVSAEGDEHGEFKESPIFSTVKGELIGYYYHHENYVTQGSTLGNSCLRTDGHQAAGVFNIYEKNPDVCSMLILRNKEMKILGRALLWHSNGNTYMDTVYYTADKYIRLFEDYAIENGFYYKSKQSRECVSFNMFNGKKLDKPAPVSIMLQEFSEEWKLPYIDSMRYIIRYKGTYRIQNAVNIFDFGSIVTAREYQAERDTRFVSKKHLLNFGNGFIQDSDHEYSRYAPLMYGSELRKKPLYKEPDTNIDTDYVKYIFYLDDVADATLCTKTTKGFFRNRYILTDDSCKVRGGVYFKQDPYICKMYDETYELERLCLQASDGRMIRRSESVVFESENGTEVFHVSDMVDVLNYEGKVPVKYVSAMRDADGNIVQAYMNGSKISGLYTETEYVMRNIIDLLPEDYSIVIPQ